jgi:hypothetical protein
MFGPGHTGVLYTNPLNREAIAEFGRVIKVCGSVVWGGGGRVCKCRVLGAEGCGLKHSAWMPFASGSHQPELRYKQASSSLPALLLCNARPPCNMPSPARVADRANPGQHPRCPGRHWRHIQLPP